MRLILQRVSHASVTVEGNVLASIGPGLLVLLGIAQEDTEADLQWLVNKLTKIRIFPDQSGKMNLSVLDTGGDVLVVSQFTLFASLVQGNRPSFTKAAKPEIAIPLYEKFLTQLSQDLGRSVSAGKFGADMQVSLVNSGPVTIIMDSREKDGK